MTVRKMYTLDENPLYQVKKVGIVCCSNGLAVHNAEELRILENCLKIQGIETVYSDCIVAVDGLASGSAQKRAECLMQFYRDPTIDAVFDISGGDIANEILPYLHYETIAAAKNKQFWGYSDLTVILNAMYAMTGRAGVLYQMRFYHNQPELFSFSYSFVQGEAMAGTVVGGNIRCLLKLAGTKYFPDMSGKILFLEARSGGVAQMITYLSQLQQMGVFEQINGILLGTFTQLQQENQKTTIEQLVKRFVGKHIAIAKTEEIGHAPDAKAIRIGAPIAL